MMHWRHHWELLDSATYTTSYPKLGGSTPSTVLLYRCIDCGVHLTKEIEGHWTIEKLTSGIISDK